MEWTTSWTVYLMECLMGFTMKSWLYRLTELLDTLLDAKFRGVFFHNFGMRCRLFEIFKKYMSQLDDGV